jgi:nicotinamidase-related amidase
MALLVMDLHQEIVDRHADGAYVSRVAEAIATARALSRPILFVGLWFRSGHPEVSARNRTFSALATRGAFAGKAPEPFPSEIAPGPTDTFVIKRRVSAFVGSDLETLLRSMEIETLVLTGIATSGVVLSTLRAAADLDYRLIVLSDGCADSDLEVHRVLLEKVFPRQADVITIAQWKSRLVAG